MCACSAFIFKYDSHVRIWILERIILDVGSLSRNLKLAGVALRGDFLYLGLRREGGGHAEGHCKSKQQEVSEKQKISEAQLYINKG